MDIDLARRFVDLAFTTRRPELTIEFQGGEPLLRFDVIRFIVEYAERKARETNKRVHFALVSNLSLMDEDIAAFIINHGITLNSSLDGPRELHNKQRIYTEGSSYDNVIYWYEYFREKYNYIIPLMPTITRYTFDYWKELVDEYARLGQRAIWIRPIRPSNDRNLAVWKKIGYDVDEFIGFYRKVFWRAFDLGLREHLMEYIIDRLFFYETNNTDVFTPCGAGRVQIAYMPDGGIYTCQEGTNYPTFRIATIDDVDDVMQLMGKSLLYELSIASFMPFHTQCQSCPYMLHCFTCPVINYTITGDYKRISDYMCKMNRFLFDFAIENIHRIWRFYDIPVPHYTTHVLEPVQPSD